MTSQQDRLGNEQRPPAQAAAGHGWRAVSIVLVGAFMALLDAMRCS
jgi:hypothetical protein